MDAQTVKEFLDLMVSVRQTFDQYLLDTDLHGVACAAGTLTARINNLKVIVGAFEDREPNPKDRFELSSLASSLEWLRTDAWITKDFAGVNLPLPLTAFATNHPGIAMSGEITYQEAITMLNRSVREVVLEGNVVPLSA